MRSFHLNHWSFKPKPSHLLNHSPQTSGLGWSRRNGCCITMKGSWPELDVKFQPFCPGPNQKATRYLLCRHPFLKTDERIWQKYILQANMKVPKTHVIHIYIYIIWYIYIYLYIYIYACVSVCVCAYISCYTQIWNLRMCVDDCGCMCAIVCMYLKITPKTTDKSLHQTLLVHSLFETSSLCSWWGHNGSSSAQ